MKIGWCWHKDGHIHHRTVWSPDTDSHICDQLILNECAKIIQWSCNTDMHVDKNDPNPCLTIHTQIK